jgi:hypothetical protein
MTKTNGRDHWTNCMSMLMAGGGIPGGQVIGSTDSRGYGIKDRPISPSDLSASVFRYFGMDLQTHWTNPQGRPIPIVTEGGKPLPELVSRHLSRRVQKGAQRVDEKWVAGRAESAEPPIFFFLGTRPRARSGSNVTREC